MADKKVALVVGATSGLGAASSIAFGRDGYRVVVAGRREAEGSAVVDKIVAAGGEAFFHPVDVGEEQSVVDLVDRTMRDYGRLDSAVNNAALELPAALLADVPTEDFDAQVRINVRGVFLGMKYQIKAMLAGEGGAIVNVASTSGHVGFAYATVYTATKHAVVGLTKSAALEYIKQGVRINAISPGVMDTEMMRRYLDSAGSSIAEVIEYTAAAIGRAARPEEIAEAVVWACSPAASYLVGQAIPVDGGITAA